MELRWPEGQAFDYEYDAPGAMRFVRENGATSVNPQYTDQDLDKTFTYNPAHQILKQDGYGAGTVNPIYVWSGTAADAAFTANTMNQVTGDPGPTITHSLTGNIVGDGTFTYGYDAINRMTVRSGGGQATTVLTYDALDRLAKMQTGSAIVRFVYDGNEIVGEHDNGTAILRRYVKGAGVDETIVWYEGATLTNRKWLLADERGSVIGVTNANGSARPVDGGASYTYDEYGRPSSPTGGSRFRYTGQALLHELGLYYYKARIYNPNLGRFMQPDPIGYGGGMNMYAYVGGDPVNMVDPSGSTPGPGAVGSGGFGCPAGDGRCAELVRQGQIAIGITYVDITYRGGVEVKRSEPYTEWHFAKTHFFVGFTNTGFFGLEHAVVVAFSGIAGIDPVVTRAGPSFVDGLTDEDREAGCESIFDRCAEATPWPRSADYGRVQRWQYAGPSQMTSQQALASMTAYSRYNNNIEGQMWMGPFFNSNTYAFSYLRSIGLNISPINSGNVPGWGFIIQ